MTTDAKTQRLIDIDERIGRRGKPGLVTEANAAWIDVCRLSSFGGEIAKLAAIAKDEIEAGGDAPPADQLRAAVDRLIGLAREARELLAERAALRKR